MWGELSLSELSSVQTFRSKVLDQEQFGMPVLFCLYEGHPISNANISITRI